MAQKLNGIFNKNEVKQRLQNARDSGYKLPLFNIATFIAFNALIDQRCKSNQAYGHHLIAVSNDNTDSETKKIIGILHDVVEDSDWNLKDLKDVGFSDRVVNAVDALTHRENEKYFDSIERCSLNKDALDVKLKDNRHNLDGSRNTFLPETKDVERQKKYILTRQYLIDVKKGNTLPGTPINEWMLTKNEKLRDWELLKKNSSHKLRSSPRANKNSISKKL
jgi:hypothetical protein